jgi:hypothetical protein
MPASSITDIRKAFDDKGVATTFAQRFLEAYTATAFGVLPTTEIDLLVFTLLVQARVINPSGSIFRTARALNNSDGRKGWNSDSSLLKVDR